MTNTGAIKNAYNSKSKEYHNKVISVEKSVWKDLLEIPFKKLLKGIIQNKNVLDLGCGSGVKTTKLLKFKPKTIVGIDISDKLIAIAKKNSPEIDFYIGDAQKTPFNSSRFDVISSELVLHYFKDLRPLLKEMNRILKKKGIFVFSIHHPIYETIRRKKEGNKSRYLLRPYYNKNLYRWHMLDGMELISYHHTFEEIFYSLKESGFIIEELIEPHKLKMGRKYKNNEIDRATKYPSFLIIQTRKL